jgi:acyl-CoA synthetase (NDP forming)
MRDQVVGRPETAVGRGVTLGFRDLSSLYAPEVVAIVGGSEDPAKWGPSVGVSLLAGAPRRRFYAVSRSKPTIFGRDTYPTFGDLPEPPEFVEVVVPAKFFEATVVEALEAGAKAIVGITAGLAEVHPEYREVERRLAQQVRAAGAVLLGPNCFGVIDNTTDLQAVPLVTLQEGDVALIAQSGNIAYDVRTRLADYRLGVRRFVSIGNQADLSVAEVLASCVGHEPTRTILIYCEDFHDGRAFVEAALAAREAGKNVVLIAPGRSAASERAAWFHTGSRTSSPAVVDAVCRAAGVYRVYTPKPGVEVIAGLHSVMRPAGRRVGLTTTGGGNGVLAADYLSSNGLDVVRFSPELTAKLGAMAPETPNPGNPIDQVGAVIEDARVMAEMADVMLSSGEVDTVILTGSPLANWWGFNDELEQLEIETGPILKEVSERLGAPVILHADQLHYPAVKAAIDAGVTTYRDIEAIAFVLDRLNDLREHPPEGLPSLPDPAAPVVPDSNGEWVSRLLANCEMTLSESVSEGAVQVALGCRWDSRFGPVAFARTLGPWADLVEDEVVALAPVDGETAKRLLREMGVWVAIADLDARETLIARVAKILVTVASYVSDHPELGQAAFEPVMISTDAVALGGVAVVDAATWEEAYHEPQR